jgi:hypothetical protein
MDHSALIPDRARDFSLLHRVQTGSGFHPAYYPVDNMGDSPGIKRSERETLH